ncbi:hypothetical protein L249_6449 [Ophiocordyceps polyrhachis-furcata BCC 54312]|uniref:Uncharacterized protein n=1 Tax=Ophiocordyceps polyrhachis-furcata BCC 54312 TaxID=1330021 RepID=A0A367LLB5_9HYPO|nr:hypothetical protein L249_6449 [Ophiocordyceps polyrhachis-furcata BCC 54312]
MKFKDLLTITATTAITTIITITIPQAQAIDPETVAKRFTNSLRQKVVIDWDSDPPESVHEKWEFTCRAHWSITCWRTFFTLRETLLKPRLSGTKAEEPLISVDYDSVPQKRVLNINSTPIPVHTEDSTWLSEATTHGWNAGATLSQGNSITLSGGYAYSKLTSHLTIKSFGISESCPGGFHCRFETWFYHVQYGGACQRTATISCDGELDMCPLTKTPTGDLEERRQRGQGVIKCSQFFKWGWSSCWDSRGSGFGVSEANCSLRIPILEANRQPLSTLVFVKEDHRGETSKGSSASGRGSRPLPHGNQDRAPVAVKAGTECMFFLDTDEWYDAFLRTYYDSSTGDWFSRLDSPAPIIPQHMHSEDCPPPEFRKPAASVDRHRPVSTASRDGTRLKASLSQRSVPPRNVEVKIVAGFRGFM